MQPATPAIYALVSPVSGKIRYIGQTTRPLQTRLTEHLSHSKHDRFASPIEAEWVRALLDEGLRPLIIMLEDCTGKDLNEREQYWLALGAELKWPLLNVSKGGAGSPGATHSEETKQLISTKMRKNIS